MPRSIFARASTENLMSLADMDASPTCPVGRDPSAQRHLNEARSVPADLSLRLVVAIGPRGIPFLALPTREQYNADRNTGEDQPERRDRARPATIALVKAEQLDEHQDHFVVDTPIIKVRSVNEATDRTVSLPIPTAMTASDMVTGVYASLASLRGWLITGSKAFKAEPAGVCTEKLKRERSDPPRRAYEVMTPIAEAGEIGASLFKNR